MNHGERALSHGPEGCDGTRHRQRFGGKGGPSIERDGVGGVDAADTDGDGLRGAFGNCYGRE